MKPPPFAYAKPDTLEEALAALGSSGDGGKVLAGGQSLGPLLNFRLARPTVLVDVMGIDTLSSVSSDESGLRVGATVTQASFERFLRTADRYPLMREAFRFIGHPATRNRGTVGGSIAHADAAAELPAVAVALKARMEVAGPDGHRVVNAEDFFLGYMTPALESDEILVSITFPTERAAFPQSWAEYAPRHGDFALVGCATVISPGSDPRVRVVLSGVGSRPWSAPSTELDGQRDFEPQIKEMSRRVASLCDPIADQHASSDYRRRLVHALVGQTTRHALHMDGGQE